MSWFDLRDLADSLKTLGYTKHIPIHILNNKHGSLNGFKIVADILQWLAAQLEPNAVLPGGTETEFERILLIRSATEFFITKSTIKLNPRKLYISNNSTPKELLKITTVLKTKPIEDDNGEDESFKSMAQLDLGDKMDDLRRARELSSEMTKRGAVLYDLLSKEMVNRETRINQSSRPMESSHIERVLKNSITSIQLKLQSAKSQLESSRTEKNALNSKLQRKKAELDRSKQRLEALQKIRPAYLEEFEELEEELRNLFQEYFQRIQCRDALKAQMQARMKNPTPIATPVTKQTAETSMTSFMPEGLIDDDDDDDDDEIDGSIVGNSKEDKNEHGRKKSTLDLGNDDEIVRDKENRNKASERLQGAQSRVRPTTGRLKSRVGTGVGRTKVIGTMLGDPDDDLLDSGDSESDIDLDGVEYGLNSDDDISLSKLTGDGRMPPRHDNHSDEDF